MNTHTCSTNKSTDSSTPGTTASSFNLPHARVRLLPSNSPLQDTGAIYTANIWTDEHLEKFSLAIDIKHCILLCQLHRIVINGSINSIENHLKHKSHTKSGFHESTPHISAALDRWGVEATTPQTPMRPVAPISGINPPYSGYQCPECPYAVNTSEAARKHTCPLGGHTMEHGQVQRVQRVYWKILPRDEWATSNPVILAPEDLAQISRITNSLINPQSGENETDDVCVLSPRYPDPLSFNSPLSLGTYRNSSRIQASSTHTKIAARVLWSRSSLCRTRTPWLSPWESSRCTSVNER